ncbi:MULTISPECIES: hypothetical protein [Saliphagus]|uniref:Uncharacterized protein n=1 Tax=Saliphagus infecundisoli TaxID=1849069 RepID=A0ABD5QKN4_9EURY|nr:MULTISPECIES: hypothetical protein [Saliphagus]
MASKQRLQEESESRYREMGGEEMVGPAFLASVASVGLSWYYFFVRGDRERGLFVGLWPPTILAFASYMNQRRMRRQLEAITNPGTKIKDAIEGVMKS